MHQIVTQIDIATSPEHVWSILMDFPAYPQWNPLAGFHAMNQALKNRAEANGEGGMESGGYGRYPCGARIHAGMTGNL